MPDDNLIIETDIRVAAEPGVVWEYLTSTVNVPAWLGCMRYEKRLGHVFYMQQDPEKRAAGNIDGATHCEILALDKPRHFAFSWYLPGTPATEVHIRLAPVADGTQVTLSHTGWDQFDAAAIREIRDALAGGWKSFVLPNLKAAVESNR